MTQTPAGWHPAPDRPGQLRYWDGAAWTEHYAPGQAAAPAKTRPQIGGDDGLPTLWEAVGKPMSGIGAGRFRLTAHYLYFERGTLKTDSQQVPVSALLDIDVRQTMSQKARGVGTIFVQINRGNRVEIVQIMDVPNFREGQQAINRAAAEARATLLRGQNTSTVRYEGVSPMHAAQAPAATAAAPAAPDYIAQLEQLAKLRDNGILSDEEFAAKKADILGRM